MIRSITKRRRQGRVRILIFRIRRNYEAMIMLKNLASSVEFANKGGGRVFAWLSSQIPDHQNWSEAVNNFSYKSWARKFTLIRLQNCITSLYMVLAYIIVQTEQCYYTLKRNCDTEDDVIIIMAAFINFTLHNMTTIIIWPSGLACQKQESTICLHICMHTYMRRVW